MNQLLFKKIVRKLIMKKQRIKRPVTPEARATRKEWFIGIVGFIRMEERKKMNIQNDDGN